MTDKKCKACGKKHYARGYCRGCYRSRQKKGEFGGEQCATDGCEGFSITIGLCANCYRRLQRKGTVDAIRITDMSGEQWLPVVRECFAGLYVSNLGRVKSCRKKDEILLSAKMRKIREQDTQETMITFTKGGHFHVALEVLRAFSDNVHNDTNLVYRDGDPANCTAENLAWYGRDILVVKAIEAAEQSDHPLADCFIKFWHGEHEAINDWLVSIQDRVRAYLYVRLRNYSFPWFMDLDDCVQQTIYDIFIALYRGMFSGFKYLTGWIFKIASAALSRSLKLNKKRPEPLEVGEGSETFSKADINMFCHPSAELTAIGREMSLC